jgi:hypothetical protein
LYRRLLGDAWHLLPAPIQRLHLVHSTSDFIGRCTVDRGRNPLAWCIAKLIGFPDAGHELPVTVRLTATSHGEHWLRNIAASEFSSVQSAGRGRSEWLLSERFGLVAADMALVAAPQGLSYRVRRWRLMGLPMPLWLGPRAIASETVEGDRFCFDVQLRHAFVGLIVRYRGWLVPQD